MLLRRLFAVPFFAAALLAAAGMLPALAADLTIGLGTDVTAIDPHYHNVTPNNNVAAHIFGYCSSSATKSRSSSPGSRPNGRRSIR